MAKWWTNRTSGPAALVLALCCFPLACEDRNLTHSAEEGAPLSESPSTQVEQDCAGMCGHAIANGCEPGDCALRCVEAVIGAKNCEQVTHDYVACLSHEGLESCIEVPPACQPAYDAWSTCASVDGGCSPVRCVDPGSLHCKCEATCDSLLVVEACTNTELGFHCTCEVDGIVVRECLNDHLSCAFYAGCCSQELPQ
jgi:hypothetical protein